jgi:hypothetical protein
MVAHPAVDFHRAESTGDDGLHPYVTQTHGRIEQGHKDRGDDPGHAARSENRPDGPEPPGQVFPRGRKRQSRADFGGIDGRLR